VYQKTLLRLQRLPPEDERLALLAILLVTWAKRQLHIQELKEAMATVYDSGSFQIGRLRAGELMDAEVIITICNGLLVLEASGEVRLIREWLEH